MEPLIAFFLALFSTIVFITLLLKVARRYNLYDKPGGRKMHTQPVPRLGGVAMAAGASLPTFIWIDLDPAFKSVLLAIGALSLMGLIDDLVRIRWHKKMLVQAAAALLVVIYGHIQIKNLGFWAGHEVLLPQYLSIPLTFFFILGVTNAINLSDGLDGLAAGMCTFIFGALAIIAYMLGLANYLVPLSAILGSIWGFLRFNTHPAAIFMGDAGSYFLGFSAAVFGIMCTQSAHSAVSPAILLLILGIPIIDTVCVMVERLIAGVSLFLPDRRHIHFRLMQIGLSHREAVMSIYALQAAFTLAAFKMLFFPASTVTTIFLAAGITLAAGLKLLEKRKVRFERKWPLEKQLKHLFGKHSETLLINLPVYATVGILSLYLIITPIFTQYQFNIKGLLILIIPVIVSICFFSLEKWFPVVSRAGIYMVVITVTMAALEPATGSHRYFGMPLWYVIMLAVLAGFTIIYLQFAEKKSIQLTPLDLLIFLVAFAFSVTPADMRPVTSLSLPAISSTVVLAYAIETALEHGTPRRNVLLLAAIAGSLIIGIRSALSLV